MSVGSKQVFMLEAEKRFGSVVTADTLSQLMPILGDIMNEFDVEQVSEEHINYDLLEAFLSAKEVEGRSPKTLERYKYVIRRVLTDCGRTTNHITVYHIRTYFMKEKQRGISNSTLEGTRSILLSYFSWLHKEGLINSNPMANLSTIKCEKIVRKPYQEEDIECLKESCKSVRDKALIMFLLSTGCRVSEVCNLNRTSIRFSALECTVVGKGNKERIVYLSPATAMMLKRYLDQRKDDNVALFIGKRLERLQPGGVRSMLRQLERKTGVANVHPHRFRRTLATNLISRGMAIQEVAAVLGHDRLDTTMKYVYLENSTVKNSYRKYA